MSIVMYGTGLGVLFRGVEFSVDVTFSGYDWPYDSGGGSFFP